jgi:hypothetical protein
MSTTLTGLTINQGPPRITIPVRVPPATYAGEEVTVKARAASPNSEADSALRTFRVFSLVNAPRALAANKLTVWPNPTNTTTQLTTQVATTGSVYDAAGKVVLTVTTTAEQPTTLDLVALPAGIYQVMLQDSNGQRYTARLRKE